MKIAMRTGLVIVSLVFGGVAMATVYSYRDAEGGVVFTDEPVAGVESTVVDPGQPMSVPALPLRAVARSVPANVVITGQSQEADASVVEIAQPLDGEALWTGGGDVSVVVDIEPKLLAGQDVVVLLDGVERARGTATEHLISGVFRGTHALEVEVRGDRDQTIARSEPVSFHVHRPSVINVGGGMMHPALLQTRRAGDAVAGVAGQ